MFVYRDTQKFSDALWHMERKFLKRIVINLPSTKDNVINVFYLDVKNHVPYTGPHKRFLIYYGLCLKTTGNVFLIVFDSLFLLH